MSKLLSKIRAIRIYSLVISSNREVRIVKDIHNVSFPNLSILDLTDNAIESI